jgi:hypothetical protein
LAADAAITQAVCIFPDLGVSIQRDVCKPLALHVLKLATTTLGFSHHACRGLHQVLFELAPKATQTWQQQAPTTCGRVLDERFQQSAQVAYLPIGVFWGPASQTDPGFWNIS